MNILGEGILNLCEIYDSNLEGRKVTYSINTEKHLLEMDFHENVINIEAETSMINVIFLKLENDLMFTFYKCSLCEINSSKCKIFFLTSLFGKFIEDYSKLLCTSVEYVINANPIPLSAISFLPQKSKIDVVNMIVECESKSNDLLITLTTNSIERHIDEFETVFFNILDIIFLGMGYYPYIISESLLTQGNKFEINHLQQSIYVNGNSDSHWTKSIISGRDLDLNKVYSAYLEKIDENELIVPVLRNVLHCSNLYTDLTLSSLIQCVEGYMRTFHKKDKYSSNIVKGIKAEIEKVLITYTLPNDADITIEEIKSSILGLIGMINQPNFAEWMYMAINYNEFTKAVFCKEIESKQIDDFLTKTKMTRIQYAHMISKKKTFSDNIELYQALNKYSLLLRILILSDLNIKIHKGSVERYINGIDTAKI